MLAGYLFLEDVNFDELNMISVKKYLGKGGYRAFSKNLYKADHLNNESRGESGVARKHGTGFSIDFLASSAHSALSPSQLKDT